jgi:phosphoribosylaminoimidazole-succinocarboxamide synthase
VISASYETAKVAGRAPLRSGKVRDLYELGGSLLLVASDRVSAFDVVMSERIPGKGIVLSAVSDYWFSKTQHLIRNQRITSRVDEMPGLDAEGRARLRGRAMLCKKAKPYPFEFVVRGYLAGSGWTDYQRSGSVSGIALPKGLRESEKLREPIFTPSTKAEAGHDEPVPFERVAEGLGRELAELLRSTAIRLYQFASETAARAGILIADTKFEFGASCDGDTGSDGKGEPILIDEVLTPDSSRFWPADSYAPGRPQNSYDKQFLRDYLLSTGWNRTPPPPQLPAEIVAKTSQKYEEICLRLTGETSQQYAARS